MAPSDALAEGGSSPTSRATRHQVQQACERCRASKLRCSGRAAGDDPTCVRCANAGLVCEFKPLATRRRRKRTDVRVSSLENELKQMRSMFEELQQPKDVSSEATTPASRSTAMESSASGSVYLPTHSALPVVQEYQGPQADFEGDSDFRGIISRRLAEELLGVFRNVALPQYPILAVPPDQCFESLHAAQPILLLAMVTAGSSAFEGDLFETLHKKLVREVVERVFIDGQRSVELVQAIVILEAWYCPAEDLRKLNFYQWIHVAGTMAQQLGLGGQTLRTTQEKVQIRSEHEMERFRTMFSVYEACSSWVTSCHWTSGADNDSVAMSMHRQPMLQFPASAHHYLSAFESHSALLNDARLVAWVKLQLISQEVEAEKVNYLHQRNKDTAQMLTKVHLLGSRFDEWEQMMDAEILTLSLRVQFHYSKAKLYELVIFAFHNAENLVPPFLDTDHSPTSDAHVNVVSPPYIKAVMALIDACHGMIKALRCRKIMDLRCCPTITFVRCVYAMKILSLLQQTIMQPRHPITQIVDSESIGLKSNVESLLASLEAATGAERCKVPTMVSGAVQRIYKQPSANGNSDHILARDDSSMAEVTAESSFEENGTDHMYTPMTDQHIQFPAQSWGLGPEGLVSMQPMSDLEEMLFPSAFWQYAITDGIDHGNFGVL